MNEHDIEIRVEKAIDRLDRRFMSDANTMTQAEYDHEVMLIDKWAAQEYRRAEPCGRIS